jgi:hypothetical protein
MSQRAKLIPVVVACSVAGALSAEEAPDLSFLEYLGSWEEGDDEWLVVAEMAVGVERNNSTDAETTAEAGKVDTETETMAETTTESGNASDGAGQDTEASDEGHETYAE